MTSLSFTKNPVPLSRAVTLSVTSQPLLVPHRPQGQSAALALSKLHEVSVGPAFMAVEIPWTEALPAVTNHAAKVGPVRRLLRVRARSPSKDAEQQGSCCLSDFGQEVTQDYRGMT